jgi:hypothetical protein
VPCPAGAFVEAPVVLVLYLSLPKVFILGVPGCPAAQGLKPGFANDSEMFGPTRHADPRIFMPSACFSGQ